MTVRKRMCRQPRPALHAIGIVHQYTLASSAMGNWWHAPSTFTFLIFQVTSEPHKLLTFYVGAYPVKQ